MGLFNFLFGKRPKTELPPEPEKIVRVIPEGAYTEPSLALKRLINDAKRFVTTDEEMKRAPEGVKETFRIHDNLMLIPSAPEIVRLRDTAIETYERVLAFNANDDVFAPNSDEEPAYSRWFLGLYGDLYNALNEFLEAAPYYWYENQIQAKKFNVTGRFKYGTNDDVIEHLKELGGTHCKWGGFYMDMLVVGSKTKPEIIEKRRRELEELNHSYGYAISETRLVMEDDLPSLWMS
jgi:hypothetical protein